MFQNLAQVAAVTIVAGGVEYPERIDLDLNPRHIATASTGLKTASQPASSLARFSGGSDWPVCTVAAFYSGVIDIVSDYLNHPTKVRDAVMGGNAQRFWRLDP
jgi:hypothetical protein